MKLKLILTSLIALVIIFLTYKVFNIRAYYIEKYEKMDIQRTNFLYQDPFISYYINNLEFPKEIEYVIELDQDDPDYDAYVQRHFKDYLSQQNGQIKYIPIYNRKNLQIRAFVLLSAGIDGKMNIDVQDTMFLDDFDNRIPSYNRQSFYRIGDTLGVDDNIKFNIWRYLFGNKDYIIYYVDIKEYLKKHTTQPYPLSELIEQIKNRNYIEQKGKIIRQVYSYSGVVYELNGSLIMKSDNFKISSDLLNDKKKEILVGEKITLSGILFNINLDQNMIEFKKSIMID